MERAGRMLTKRWPADPALLEPRSGILQETHVTTSPPESSEPVDDEVTGETTDDAEVVASASFEQADGPFVHYSRTVTVTRHSDGDEYVERTRYRLDVPWFGWLFGPAVRAVLARRISPTGWWTPPDRLDPQQVLVLGLLAAASMSAAFVNTLFTQTVAFAADEFDVSDTGIGIGGAVVRAGILIALPAAVLADRIGRRRVIVAVAWLGPALSLLGAIAPSYPLLVATQTIARPMGIALAFLIGVVAAEEMPRSSRAYAVSILAMASGLGAGIAVLSLRLADTGDGGWRLVYLLAAIWLIVAIDLTRRLPETRRFQAADITPTSRPPRLNRGRLLLLAAVAFAGNIFIAPVSFFQNRYLTDVHDFSGGMIGIFSIAVGTPAGIGLIIGGRLADTAGRRILIAITLPLSTIALVGAYSVGGPPLWLLSLVGGMLASAAYPALAVYRNELFPTGNRGRASGLLTASALVGGIFGLIATGLLLDESWGFGSVMAVMGIGQFVVTALVLLAYPETAHTELETLNPEDQPGTPTGEQTGDQPGDQDNSATKPAT
ncbi:MAG: MFS transporter [Actinomycetota bacterium]